MMNIKLIKIILRILLSTTIIIYIMSSTNISQAASFWDNIFEGGGNFLEIGKNEATKKEDGNVDMQDKDVQGIINDIYNILFPLGVVITVIIGGVLGIKFMTASVDEKAKVKESMIPYVVGCIAIYGAFGIWKICIEVLSAIS